MTCQAERNCGSAKAAWVIGRWVAAIMAASSAGDIASEPVMELVLLDVEIDTTSLQLHGRRQRRSQSGVPKLAGEPQRGFALCRF